jgi:hypothetical protein
MKTLTSDLSFTIISERKVTILYGNPMPGIRRCHGFRGTEEKPWRIMPKKRAFEKEAQHEQGLV